MAEKPNFGQKLFEGLAQGWNNYAIDRQKQQDVKRDNAGQTLQFAIKKQQMDAENQQRTLANQKLNLEIMKLTTDMHKTPEQRAEEKAAEQQALLQGNLNFATQNQGQLQTLGQAGLEIPGINFNPQKTDGKNYGIPGFEGLSAPTRDVAILFGPDAAKKYVGESRINPSLSQESYANYLAKVRDRNAKLTEKNADIEHKNKLYNNNPKLVRQVSPLEEELSYEDWRAQQERLLGITPDAALEELRKRGKVK